MSIPVDYLELPNRNVIHNLNMRSILSDYRLIIIRNLNIKK